MITADQIYCHLVGDYTLQSDRMAQLKTSNTRACLLHVIWYMVPFLFLGPSFAAWLVMAATHFAIDRWRLARYLCWAKNRVLGTTPPWKECQATGYPPDRPAWLSVWLLIIADNILHIGINAAALRWL